MRDASPTRRALLRTATAAAVAGLSGCSALGGGTDAVDCYLFNETDTELRVTLHYLDCEQVGREQHSIGVEAGQYAYSANEVVANSGPCALEVTTARGHADTYEWDVGRETLVVTVTPDAVTFDLRAPTYTPDR
jgi:hypothetical protein